MWKLAVPGKIKIFGWRVLKGFVPCKGILFNRHIADDADCPFCPSRMVNVDASFAAGMGSTGVVIRD
jgi:hypothetical protein